MTKLTRSQLITIIGLLLLILALPVALFLSRKKQDIRPKAALVGKANFLLSADSTKSSVGKNIIVYVTLQLTDDKLRASGVDFTLIYDKDKLEVAQIVPALKIYNPTAAFTDALSVSSGGTFDNQYDFLRVAEVIKTDNRTLPKGTMTLAKIIFRGIGEGQATIKFPDDDKYAQVVGIGTYLSPTPAPPCKFMPTPPACLYQTPPCLPSMPEEIPPGGWCPPLTCIPRPPCLDNSPFCKLDSANFCPPGNNPSPTCVPPPTCLSSDPPCLIPEPAGGWCPNVGINKVKN